MPLLSEAEFASFLVYSPKGIEKPSKNSKALGLAIKEDGFLTIQGKLQRVIPFVVKLLKARMVGTDVEGFFSTKPILVPAPRSAPARPGSLFPTHVICKEMVACGLGSETRLLLERTKAVPKAATSAPPDRPTIQTHYESMRVNRELLANRSILVVDDFVTRGTMFLASISRLTDVYPDAEIKAFALVRTMSGLEVPHVVELCRGIINRRDTWCTRRP